MTATLVGTPDPDDNDRVKVTLSAGSYTLTSGTMWPTGFLDQLNTSTSNG